MVNRLIKTVFVILSACEHIYINRIGGQMEDPRSERLFDWVQVRNIVVVIYSNVVQI